VSLRSLLLLSSAACAALIAAPALAQEADPTQLDEVVVTGSQVDLRPAYAGGQVATGGRVGMFGALDDMDTPFATTAYTEELARNQQARSVADVLQNDPMVRVAKGFGNFQELYVIRGFPVFSDDMSYNGVYGILPRQYVAAELLERVEVFHGATAFLNGAAPGGTGVGGAFNLVPKRALSDDLTRATLGYAPDSQFYGALDLSRRFGEGDDYGVRFNLARRGGEAAIDDQDTDLTVAALGLDHRGDRLRFSADVGFQDHHIDAPRPQVTPLGDVPTPPSADGNFAQPWTYSDEQQLFGVVRGEYEFSDSVTAWAALGARDGEEANVLANPAAFSDGTTSTYRFDNARKDVVVSADAGVRAHLSTGSVDHQLVFSAAMLQSKSRNAYAFSNFAGFAGDLYNPVPVAPPAANFFTGGSMSDPHVTERVETSSLALADMVEFMDGKLIAILGARYQELESRTYDYNTGAFSTVQEGDALTPALGLVYKPSPWVSLYANYAEALIPGQTAPAVINGETVTNRGEALEPFVGEQIEAGFKFDAGHYAGTFSVFQTTLANDMFEGGLFSSNGEQRNRGVELSVRGEPVEGVRLLGGVTWIDAQLTETADADLDGRGDLDGHDAIGVPDFQANANVEWDVPALDGLTLEGRVIFTGEQEVNLANTDMLDAWTRVDLGARYAFDAGDRPVIVRARVENVADENYWASTGGYPDANYLVLGSPRTFVLSASVDF
jgi:iron complex outermembrane receptor protein